MIIYSPDATSAQRDDKIIYQNEQFTAAQGSEWAHKTLAHAYNKAQQPELTDEMLSYISLQTGKRISFSRSALRQLCAAREAVSQEIAETLIGQGLAELRTNDSKKINPTLEGHDALRLLKINTL